MNAETNIEINNTTIMCSGAFQFLYLTLDFLVNQGQNDHLNETCQPLESLINRTCLDYNFALRNLQCYFLSEI